MDAGTELFRFPAPPSGPPQAPPPPLRYRSFRGKSVSSLRPPKALQLDVCQDQVQDQSKDQDQDHHPSANDSNTGRNWFDHASQPRKSSFSSLRAMRRRSKSVTSTPTRHALSPTSTGSDAARAVSGPLFRPPTRDPPALPPVIIAPDGVHQGPETSDLTAQPPFLIPPFSTGLKRKPINAPSSPTISIHNVALKSPAHPDVARYKSLNDLSSKFNSATFNRGLADARHEIERRYLEEKEAARWATEVARLEAETDRILAEQKKRDAARAQAQIVTPRPKPKYLLLEKFTFLSRSRRSNATSSQGETPSPSPTAPTVFSLEFSRSSSLEDSISPSPDKMSFIEQGGRGVVPQVDAPSSASNGGERVSALQGIVIGDEINGARASMLTTS